jgi:hypothetical protein
MISFIPPDVVAKEAELGLAIRRAQPNSNKCCTSVGIRRATQLANKQPVSFSTIKRMHSYFARHEIDKEGKNWGIDSKGYQAWLCWGGDSGREWVNVVLDFMNQYE